MPAENPGRGVTYEGLRRNPGRACGHLFEIGDGVTGDVDCTHGPDPAPPGIDVRQSRPPVVVESSGAQSAPVPSTGFACYEGGGTGGARVQLIYAYAADKPDRSATYADSFQAWAAQIDAQFSRSAQETGHIRHVRFVTDAACKPKVDVVQLTATGDDSFDETLAELRTKGYNLDNRKYLVWTDATVYCGLGQMHEDDSVGTATTPNRHNARPGTKGMFARVDSGCWGQAESHELMHTLGGVQASAPHATAGHHCWDDHDAMCYDDSSPTTDGVVTLPGGGTQALSVICPATPGDRLDCNHDDYFHTSPVAGSYLATHWNTANSVFLAPWGLPDPPASVTTDPREGQVTVTWTAPPSDGGSPVTSYKLAIYDGAAMVGSVFSTADATISPHSFAGLTNGKTYTVQVQALTAHGASTPKSATVTPQSLGVAVVGPTTMASPVVATFTQPVQAVSTSNFRVHVDGTTTRLSGSLSCQNVLGATVSCTRGPVKTAKLAVAPVPGEHYVATITPPGTRPVISVDTASSFKALPATSASFRTLNGEETSPLRTEWAVIPDTSAHGGSYTTERQPTAQATYGFTGTGITWYTVTGPDQGIADVYIDDVLTLAAVNNYSPARAYNVARTISGLAAGAHTFKIVVKGTTGSSAATDSSVSVDALLVDGGALVTTPALAYVWSAVSLPAASGGRYVVSDVTGASASLTFRGTGITVWFVRSPDAGQVTSSMGTTNYSAFDLYNSTTGVFGLTYSGLADGTHTLTLRVAPSKNPSSAGTKVAIDGWAVR